MFRHCFIYRVSVSTNQEVVDNHFYCLETLNCFVHLSLPHLGCGADAKWHPQPSESANMGVKGGIVTGNVSNHLVNLFPRCLLLRDRNSSSSRGVNNSWNILVELHFVLSRQTVNTFKYLRERSKHGIAFDIHSNYVLTLAWMPQLHYSQSSCHHQIP